MQEPTGTHVRIQSGQVLAMIQIICSVASMTVEENVCLTVCACCVWPYIQSNVPKLRNRSGTHHKCGMPGACRSPDYLWSRPLLAVKTHTVAQQIHSVVALLRLPFFAPFGFLGPAVSWRNTHIPRSVTVLSSGRITPSCAVTSL